MRTNKRRGRIGGLILSALAFASIAYAANIGVTKLATGTSDVQMVAADASFPPVFCGFFARETVGSASATVDIYAGTSTSGRLMATFSLAANESRSEGIWPDASCLDAREGIWVDRGGSGSTLLIIFTRGGGQ